MPRFCKYKYLSVKKASLTIVKYCVTIGPIHGWQIFHLMHLSCVSFTLSTWTVDPRLLLLFNTLKETAHSITPSFYYLLNLNESVHPGMYHS